MLSDMIKKERNKRGISQMEFSKIIGVSQQTIGSWETGRTSPDIEMIKKLAQYFNVTTDYLLGNDLIPGLLGNSEKLGSSTGYYHDQEVAAIAQEMHDKPEIRVLFDATRGLKKESIEEVKKFVEFQKAKERGDM